MGILNQPQWAAAYRTVLRCRLRTYLVCYRFHGLLVFGTFAKQTFLARCGRLYSSQS